MTNETESRDIEEITLALTLLGVVTAVLLKSNDFFNNNAIILSPKLYAFVNTSISFLLVEFLIIFLFFIIKGISIYIEPQKRKDDHKKGARILFKLSFIYAFVWFIGSTLIYIFYAITTVYDNYLKPYYIPFAILYSFFVIIISLWIFFDLLDSRITKKVKEIIENFKNKIEQNYRLAIRLGILFIIIGILLIIFRDLFSRLLLDFMVLPSYLLAGSFSIEEFPQPIDNADNLTFIIKETGFPYNFNYIMLYKINSNRNLRQYVDNITINRTQETPSNETFMLGENYDGIWYLVINTSRLQCKFQSGTYMLHAEVTDEPTENSTFGIIRKRADKLFYIPPKNTTCSLNST